MENGSQVSDVPRQNHFMQQDQTTIAGERTQEGVPTHSLCEGKTAHEWCGLHEVMRSDFERVLREKESAIESLKSAESKLSAIRRNLA